MDEETVAEGVKKIYRIMFQVFSITMRLVQQLKKGDRHMAEKFRITKIYSHSAYKLEDLKENHIIIADSKLLDESKK